MATLESVIIAKYGRLITFAKEIGWTYERLTNVLSHPQYISLKDLKTLNSKLNIHDPITFYQVFFPEEQQDASCYLPFPFSPSDNN